MTSLKHQESKASLLSQNDEASPLDYFLRVQLPNDMTTVIQVQGDMTMWEILCVISSKKQLTPSHHIAKMVYSDGKEEIADEARALNTYHGLERVILQKRAGETANPARMRQGRRASVVLNAPKPSAIRMSSQEFPKTVTDEAALALRLAAGKADTSLLARRGKTIKNVAMLFFNKKSATDMSGELGSLSSTPPESPRPPSGLSQSENNTSSLSLTMTDEDKAEKKPAGRFSTTSRLGVEAPSPIQSADSSLQSMDSDLDTLASYDGKKSPPNGTYPILPPLPNQSGNNLKAFSNDVSREAPKNLRRSVTSLGFNFMSGDACDRESLTNSSQSISIPDGKNNSAGAIDEPTLTSNLSSDMLSLSRADSLVAREPQAREKIRKRTISSPATSGSSGYSTLRRPVLRTNRQRSNTDVLSGIETAIEVPEGPMSADYALTLNTPTTPILADDPKRVVLKVSLPDLQSTTIMIQPDLTMETVLLNICQKRKLDFDHYTLDVPKEGVTVEMDRPLSYYIQEGINEVMVVRKEKTYSTMCVSEGGRDVMILQLIGGKLQVMAATPEKLIERLTDDAEKDPTFMDTLLLTYRSFIKPLEFFDQLVARFNSELPPDPSPEDVEYFNKMKVPTQRRVIAAFKWWVKHHYHDFGVDGSIKADLEDFVDQIRDYNDGEFASDAAELYRIMETQSEAYQEMFHNYKTVERRGKTIEGMVQEISVEDLSQQLCIHNFKLFHNIHPIEYLNQIWQKTNESSPSMIYFIERFDKESYWASTEILKEKDLKKRTSLLRKFILTAKMCQELSNFFTMFALIAGLNMPPIQRLKKTWEALPDKAKKAWAELEKVADPSRNMKNYRDLLNAATPPIVPFLPIYLKDLTFMNDGNESKIGTERQMINFDKLRMMGNRVKDISGLARVEYSFEPKPAIQNFLAKPPVEKSMTKLKEMSLECEK
ncbi:uncharacterized protein SPPG_03749 [Spizellomyces punctatus DAOM BR117]|uniref:Ras-GEF domain-containing protein n=1 Tax=Spizellomyces punctatus (strain DAOM BR117) TaxID=645134 RepID=A0A0L0HGN4_SPIPD|nr:uncharacterized protein SPPG_03749 [Spizellomyces punctatus DAOM BR117]KND00621.1 hypothetical protein SPPG_03749 [Spizellomyces punctatus DAOM BR117]|eukprot:XP_016608660.1 hypothetical protein SPPG_03749 [Spizellomyces punctatus DAOM BR117]